MQQLFHQLLEDIVVVDLSARLPGPYAGYLLAQMGATVIKIENTRYPDAFSDEALHQMDPIFKVWYEKLNQNKEKITLDFQSVAGQEQLQNLLASSHIVLAPNSKKVINACGLGTIAENHPLSIIQIGGGKSQKSLHDLNSLAESQAFNLHIHEPLHGKNPGLPFLPWAGIGYGQQIVSEALACHLKVSKQLKSVWHEIFLDSTTQMQLAPFWSEELKKGAQHLHTGLFPCYNLYHTKDNGIVAVAAVEEHFWDIFTKNFELSLTADDRYDTSNKVFEIIKSKIASLTTKEAKTRIKEQDCCVSIIE